jgi:hypothetical protein
MATSSTTRERRDWTLIVFLLPIGILLMLVAGQVAIRLVPSWSVEGGMQSSLDPQTASKNEQGQIQPILLDILTPMGWLDSFLTPGPDSGNDGVSFAPFIILEPSLTPSATTSATATDTATATATPAATTTTPTWTPTDKPGDDDDTPPAPKCTDPLATNNGGPLPCTYPPTTCTDPLANNNGGPLPCIYPNPSPLVGSSGSVPGNTNIGAPDGSVGTIPDGSYVVIDLSGNPIVVVDPSETNYDFVYYELPSGSGIQMDSVILSISTDNIVYYVVFNWGDGTPDNNSNVGDVAANTGTENDNQPIDQPDTGELHGTAPQDTGIAVDVDNAPSNPPPGNYSYLAIQAPAAPPADGNDGADADSVEVVEVAP